MGTLPDGLEPVEGEPACRLSEECRKTLVELYENIFQETIDAFKLVTGKTMTRDDVRRCLASRETPAQGVNNLLAMYPGDDLAEPSRRALYYEILAKRDDAVRFVAGIMGTG